VAEVFFAAPVLPGKEEGWRRFVQELSGSRRGGYEGLCRRLGVREELVWLLPSPRGGTVVARIEIGDPRGAMRRLAASEHPFDLWLKERLLEFHGIDLPLARPGGLPEPVFGRPGPPGPEVPRPEEV
jgi:hypothetical protein